MATAYTYGSFNLNNNAGGYFLQEKNLDSTDFHQTYAKVARQDGVKKTGEVVNERQIQVKLKVVGVSRPDLESKLDALYQALRLRQQPLSLHALDSRYFIADAISAKTTLGAGTIIGATVAIVFACQNPYAVAASTLSYDTGTLTLSLLSGSAYTFPTINIAGTGTAVALPTIRVYAENNVAMQTVAVNEVTDSRILTVLNNLPSASGDYIDIYCDPNALPPSGYSVLKNGANACAFIGLFPVLQPTATSFLITVTASSTPHARAVLTWYPRFVS